MKYQDWAEAVQAADEEANRPAGRTDANINPLTGLATDYLNHFNEAIMLLEMLPSWPDCRSDFLGWRPMSYREHFAASHFKGRDMAIAAYDAADPDLRARLNALADTMTAVLEATRSAMRSEMPPEAVGIVGERAADLIKPLIARAGAVINGQDGGDDSAVPQTVVDGLMKR